MTRDQPTERLRITARSAVLAVAMLGTTLALLRLVVASQRVLGWVLAAAAVAGLLHPLVALLSRRVHRGLAVGLVAVATIGTVGGLVYRVVDDLAQQTRALERAAPEAAARIERNGPLREVARDVHLADRTRRIVREIPERLRGGTPAEALRSAATRGVAFLATGVLSLFFLLHGPHLVDAGLRQVHDDRRRERIEAVLRAAGRRGFGYARGTLAMAAASGMLTFSLAEGADVTGPAALAVWAALWDVVPMIGVVVGGIPLVGLAAADDPGTAVLLAGILIGYQLFEAVVLQRRIERVTVRLGPFLTVAGGLIGVELYGIGGALLVLLALTFAIAVGDEVAPE